MKTRSAFNWEAAARQVAIALPRERLEPAVLAWLAQAGRTRRGWGVAVSGGADSLALLLLLWAHGPELRRRLTVLHFDHRLRGEASRDDARFCRDVARALGLPFATAAWRRPRGADRPSEAEARAARLAFFATRTRVVFLAHHQDDVAETLLMRLARGSGSAGLSAPRPVQRFPNGRVHLRPLLGIKKADLVGALRAAGVPWREDATNAGPAYLRNRIRQQVLPRWVEAAQRDAVAGAALSRRLLEDDDTALEAWVDELAPLTARGQLEVRRLAGKPRAVVRRALHRWLLQLRGPPDLSRQAFEALVSAVERGQPTRHSLGSRTFAVLSNGLLSARSGKSAGKIHRSVN